MRREDIIRMAREAGLAFDYETYPGIWHTYLNVGREKIERFAALIAAAEREECAKVCETVAAKEIGMAYEAVALDCAAALRKRGAA